MSLTSRRYDVPLCFIHTALSPGNLIVDPQTGRLTGILDWTDTMLGDAARDFADLVMWRGWTFTDYVLRNYQRPVDEGFRDRISFSARLVSTVVLTEAHAHGMEIAAYVNGVRNAFAA
jgi:aminoglycoside phosphotransferase (APT) family kinase protein